MFIRLRSLQNDEEDVRRRHGVISTPCRREVVENSKTIQKATASFLAAPPIDDAVTTLP